MIVPITLARKHANAKASSSGVGLGKFLQRGPPTTRPFIAIKPPAPLQGKANFVPEQYGGQHLFAYS